MAHASLPRRRYSIGAPPFRPDRIAEGWKPPSAFKRSNILSRYCHQKKRKEVDPHYQKYYQGRLATDVTEHLKPSIPGNPFQEPVFFPHKATDVTELYEKAGKLPKRPATAPDYTYGVKATDVTEIYRHVPPGRYPKQLPHFGIKGSAVTDPSRYVDTSGLPFLSWWENPPLVLPPNSSRMPLSSRPDTAPQVVEKAFPTPLWSFPGSPKGKTLCAFGASFVREICSFGSCSFRRRDTTLPACFSRKPPPPSECNTARSAKSKAASKSSGVGSGDKNAAKPPRPKHKTPGKERTSLGGLPSLTAETLEKLGLEKLDRVTKWAGELQTWAIPEAKRPPKPTYEERDHSRKKTDVTSGVYVW